MINQINVPKSRAAGSGSGERGDMIETRILTIDERKAIDRLEWALADIPSTLALHFNESGFHVFDKEIFSDALKIDGRFDDYASDWRPIKCRYDVGAL